MAGAAGAISHTTLHEAASGSRLPSWPTTRSYVRACGGHEVQWRRRWLAASCAASGRETADHRPPEPQAALPSDRHPHPIRRCYEGEGGAGRAAARLVVQTSTGVWVRGSCGSLITPNGQSAGSNCHTSSQTDAVTSSVAC